MRSVTAADRIYLFKKRGGKNHGRTCGCWNQSSGLGSAVGVRVEAVQDAVSSNIVDAEMMTVGRAASDGTNTQLPEETGA